MKPGLSHDQHQNQVEKPGVGNCTIFQHLATPPPRSHVSWDKRNNPCPLRNDIIPISATIWVQKQLRGQARDSWTPMLLSLELCNTSPVWVLDIFPHHNSISNPCTVICQVGILKGWMWNPLRASYKNLSNKLNDQCPAWYSPKLAGLRVTNSFISCMIPVW